MIIYLFLWFPQVNRVGLKIRASVITTVYNKALSVSLTTLSEFTTGEV